MTSQTMQTIAAHTRQTTGVSSGGGTLRPPVLFPRPLYSGLHDTQRVFSLSVRVDLKIPVAIWVKRPTDIQHGPYWKLQEIK